MWNISRTSLPTAAAQAQVAFMQVAAAARPDYRGLVRSWGIKSRAVRMLGTVAVTQRTNDQ